jgi:HAD superfamily hydrolase (TIGR01549 family)
MKHNRAVLFDIGGPIDTEINWERRVDAALRATVAEAGGPADDRSYAAACRRAVASHAPNAYQAILWALLGERAQAAWAVFRKRVGLRGALELRPSIAAVLNELHQDGVPLGLVANQPAEMLSSLRDAGIADCFTGLGLSGIVGVRKPDPRIFLGVCDALGLAPEVCIMVGDRIDNDIAPARALGMATIRVRGGRHARQRPRSWLEVPDVEVENVAGLRAALRQML